MQFSLSSLNLNSIFPILITALIIYVMLRNIIINRIKEESPLQIISHSYVPGYVYVDVREQEEYYKGHIARSVNIPLSKFKHSFRNIPNDKIVIVICKNGNRSKKAISFLKDNGYDKLISLKGGTEAWAKAGYPLEYGV